MTTLSIYACDRSRQVSPSSSVITKEKASLMTLKQEKKVLIGLIRPSENIQQIYPLN